MAEQTSSFVDEAGERFTAARERVDSEVSRIQKELATRRKRIERQTRKQVNQIEKDIRTSEVVKTLESWRGRAASLLEHTVRGGLGALQIASKNDVQKIDRKLTKLTKRLREIERTRQTNGAAAPLAETPPA